MAPSLAVQDPLARSIDISLDDNRQETAVQREIDQIDDQTQAMLEAYQRLSRELEMLTVYDDQLQQLVASQESEKQSIQQQMAELEQTQREVVPLILEMVQWLETLLDADLPFLPEERRLRIAQLHELMGRADVSIGEKYRRVLEAYQIEMDYSRTIESYRGELKNGNQVRTVDFLRIGRLALYYQTIDRAEVGHWNAKEGRWVALPEQYELQIRNGLRIARQQLAPDLLHLPVAVPGERQP